MDRFPNFRTIKKPYTHLKPGFHIYFNGSENIYIYIHIIYTYVEIKTQRKHNKTLKLGIDVQSVEKFIVLPHYLSIALGS